LSLITFAIFLGPCRASYSTKAIGPSAFLRCLYDTDGDFVKRTIAAQAASINRDVKYVLDRLSVNASTFVEFLRNQTHD